MTLIEAGRPVGPIVRPVRPVYGPSHRGRVVHRRRPGPARPTPGAMRYLGTGVGMSHAPHRRRSVSAAVTAALACAAALITVWLAMIAQSGGVTGTPAAVPDQLAVVRVQPGENLQHLAARVAPDAPVGQVVARIRELNHLDSAVLDSGQTLIAPVGPGGERAH